MEGERDRDKSDDTWTPLGVAAARALVKIAGRGGLECPPEIKAAAQRAPEQ